MTSALDSYLSFWGKAKAYAGEPVKSDPAVYHMLDVAAVFSLLFDQMRPDWIDARLKPCLLLLTALHDIGKLTTAFQAQAPAHWPHDVLGPFTASSSTTRHDTLGYQIIASMLLRDLPTLWPGSNYMDHWRPLVRASTGHHGLPPKDESLRRPPPECNPACQTQVRSVYADLVDLFTDPSAEPAPIPSENEINRIHWWYAGLVNLADWIGSAAPHWFQSHRPTLTVREYWHLTLTTQAPHAVAHSGVLPCAVENGREFGELFGFSNPTPMQAWCTTTRLHKGPKLIFLEDETGIGKSEAGSMLAYRIMEMGDARGIYFALPTMATANGMYGRVAAFYRKFFRPDQRPSLSLPHSKANLHPEFRQSVIHALASVEQDADAAECAAWLADDRRRALLADIGVGTIDQAFLSVMRAKYAPLRMAALAGKVLIIDEAHAYDTYMVEILKALLAFHAMMGGSVIILSATLPQRLRQDLADAFLCGLGAPPVTLAGTGYPLVTMLDGTNALELPLGLTKKNAPVKRRGKRFNKRVVVESNYSTIVADIERAALAGAKVAWVRSTVKQAIETAELLRARGIVPADRIDLFHSRFVVGDRTRIEGDTLATYGKHARRGKSEGRILIATQVVEQSLDLDFDLMVSDPAPLDLLLQRMGRLWRHQRRYRPGVKEPVFIIAGPNPTCYPTSGWLFHMSQEFDHQNRVFELAVEGSFYVYRNLALLWRSVLIMQREQHVGDRSRFRQMIEAAYNEAPFVQHYGLDFEPIAFAEAQRSYENQENDNRWMGADAPLRFEAGYVDTQWRPEDEVRTRLGRHTIDIRLARIDAQGALVPICPPDPGLPRWAYSEVRTDEVGLLDNVSALHQQAVDDIRAGWRGFEQRVPLIPLRPVQDGWYEGEVVTGRDRVRHLRIRYSHEFGLVVGG